MPRRALRDAQIREVWLGTLEPNLVEQVRLLWMGYEIEGRQVRLARAQLAQRARAFAIIAHWSALPGMGLIRATTLFAYLDTPWRSRKKTKLWKYCGVGLERASSGQDRYGCDRSARLRLAWAVNRQLKNVIVDAALPAIRSRDNVFRQQYKRMIREGVVARNARHAVARRMLAVMWGVWKNERPFDAGFC